MAGEKIPHRAHWQWLHQKLISKINLLFNENLVTLQKQFTALKDTKVHIWAQGFKRQVLWKHWAMPWKTDRHLESFWANPAETQEQKYSKSPICSAVGRWHKSSTLFKAGSLHYNFLRALSVLIMNPFPSVSPSLPLAGLPASVFTLCGTASLVCRTASSSSAFLLPFPLLLAGESVERRSQGADPVAAGERKKRNAAGVRGAGGWQTDRLKEHLKTAIVLPVYCWGIQYIKQRFISRLA